MRTRRRLPRSRTVPIPVGVIAKLRPRLVSHADETVVCVTTDNTLAYKVDAKGFTVVDPAEKDRLPDEPDPSEVEKRELQKTLVELESRVNPRPRPGPAVRQRQRRFASPSMTRTRTRQRSA